MGTALVLAALAADAPIYSDRPSVIDFPPQQARFVRFVLQGTPDGSQGCIDELEVYGPDGKRNLALATAGSSQAGVASARACGGLNRQPGSP